MKNRLRRLVLLLLLPACLLPGCAKNPVSDKHQLMLITREQEFDIGRGADPLIKDEFGVYLENPALREYVDRVGNSLAMHGERPELVFHFEILNTPDINAFALPGGFVYVTRGMLERLSSEDELAMVLGHEIGHVTARHGASRISTAYALQYGSLLGAIISPRTFSNYNDLIGLALQVGMSRYSREQESQSDELGIRYATAAGYGPEAGLAVMNLLAWLEGEEPGALEKWFLSHPPADERKEDIERQIEVMEQETPGIRGREPRRDEYLQMIDGLVVGLHNGAEMVLRDHYYNRQMFFSARVPEDWDVNLDPHDSITVFSSDEEEYIVIDAEPMHRGVEPADVEARFEKTLKSRGWKRIGGNDDITRQGVAVRLARYEGTTHKGEPVGVLVAFLAHDKREWNIIAATAMSRFTGTEQQYLDMIRDFHFLTKEEVSALEPPRVSLIPAADGATWASLALEHLSSTTGAERLAFYNGMDPDAGIPPGTLIKIPPSLTVAP